MRKIILIALLSMAVGLIASTPSLAVHKNYNNVLTCGNCHTMHNSQGNSSLGGATGGSLILLRGNVSSRAEIHNFCLQCHGSNGAQAASTFGTDNHPAPKVYIDGKGGAGNSTTAGTLDNFAVIGAGGDFSAELSGNSSGWNLTTAGSNEALGRGHSLGLTSPTPPGSAEGAISNFSCTSCHDPHGAYNTSTATVNKYRNLRKIPTGSGTTSVSLHNSITSYVGDPSGPNPTNFIPSSTNSNCSTPANCVWPLYDQDTALSGNPTTDASISNTYPVGNSGSGLGTDGISYWCATCHDNWHEGIVAGNASGNDWKRHPVDTLLNDGTTTSGAGVTIVDTTNYDNTSLSALPVAPVAGSAADQGVAYLISGQEANSKVFCLSCHFAHGGPYYDNLRWDYLSSVSAGSQQGNGISSTTGCQLCHNR